MLTVDVVYKVYLFYNAILWVSSFIEYIRLSVYWKWSLKAFLPLSNRALIERILGTTNIFVGYPTSSNCYNRITQQPPDFVNSSPARTW